jgi:hypothetical protein
VALLGGQVVQVKGEDAGGSIGIDHDEILLSLLLGQPDAREAVPLDEDLVLDLLVLGIPDVEDVIAAD